MTEAGRGPTAPIVTVRGEARVEVPPDRAHVSVTVHATGSAAKPVHADLARASAAVREVLEPRSAALEQYSTRGLSVDPVFGRSGNKITGYRGSFTTSITVQDFEALSDLVPTLAALPNSQVDGPTWFLHTEHPARREVRLAAIADARRRADDYAAAFGASLTGLVEVSDLESDPSGWRMNAMAVRGRAVEQDAPAFDFEPALQTVSGQITVRFTISEPDLG